MLKDLGRQVDAEEAYRQSLRLQPEFPEALTNLGNLLVDVGQQREAEQCCREATIRLRPDFPEPHNNLGNLLRGVGRFEDAEAACRQALRLRPGYLSALNKIWEMPCAIRAGFSEAEDCYRLRRFAGNQTMSRP